MRLIGATKRWVGLSTDVKPTTDVNTGDEVFETDTKRVYIYGETGWTLKKILVSLEEPGIIGGTTPGIIYGLTKEIAIASNATLTSLQCSGTIVSNYGMTDADCSITLPAAAEGLAFLCILPAVRAKYFRLQSAGTDKIYLSGTAGTGPGYVGVDSGYVTGAACSVFAFKAADGGFDWYCNPIFGTWVAG